jgi:beta-lactamase superfamily II metal-dependent hydrolase
MYEVDFLPVESEAGSGSKSGDAIAVRFTVEGENRKAIMVIDSGYADVGDDMVSHITNYYNGSYIDLVVSTHPDADHLNGLTKVLEEFDVGELWVHRPRLHRADVSDFSNLESLDNLIVTAARKGVAITEPFAGESRFNEQLFVLGPTREYYEELLDQHLAEEREGARGLAASLQRAVSSAISLAGSALDSVLAYLPFETLTDEGETGPRNNMSTVLALQVDGRRLMFTGDAGMPALEGAADVYELIFGSFGQAPLRFIQVPHHGSKRNVGPTILNRILGEPGAPHSSDTTAFISSAKASKKHPSAKVVNAFTRRGCSVNATEGTSICHHLNGPDRGWAVLTPIPPLDESLDDE